MKRPRQSHIDSLDSLLQSETDEAHEARAQGLTGDRQKIQDEQSFTALIIFDLSFQCLSVVCLGAL